jgi:hypothetical protein
MHIGARTAENVAATVRKLCADGLEGVMAEVVGVGRVVAPSAR